VIRHGPNPAVGRGGLGDNAFPGGNSNSDIATKPIYIQAIAGLKREFVSECAHSRA
jgi:hypothetical protein